MSSSPSVSPDHVSCTLTSAPVFCVHMGWTGPPFPVLSDFAIDMDLRVVQAGSALQLMVPELDIPGAKIDTALQIRHPGSSWDLEHVLRYQGRSKVVLSSERGLEMEGGLYRVRQMQRDADGELKEGGDVVM